MIDRYYTPKVLADNLISYCQLDAPLRIADFAVGGGSLLSAATTVFPKAKLFGVDVDIGAIKASRIAHPKANLFNMNFLNSNEEGLLQELVGNIDLILLNPPFSYRGSKFETTFFEGEYVKSSKAMAFLLASCQYLNDGGEILAILPRSCLFSEKDEHARSAILNRHELEDLGVCQSPGFNGASVSVHIVRVIRSCSNKDLVISAASLAQLKPERAYGVAIMRGNHPVAFGSEKLDAPSLIHTTDLFNGEIAISRRRAVKLNRQISGQVLMIPRVARPNRNKVAVGNFVRPVVASDCILAMKTVPPGNEIDLQVHLQRFWCALESVYSGTCASYLTLSALKNFLVSMGYQVTISCEPSLWNPGGIPDPIEVSRGRGEN